MLTGLRQLAAISLEVSARLLRLGASMADSAARELEGTAAAPPARPASSGGPRPFRPEPVTVASASRPQPARTDEELRALLRRPAREVTSALDGLSSDELARLFEYESAGKDRSSVLDAIERQVLPD